MFLGFTDHIWESSDKVILAQCSFYYPNISWPFIISVICIIKEKAHHKAFPNTVVAVQTAAG